ncbi:hypothetical protein D3C71_1571320 [compost metagenome]
MAVAGHLFIPDIQSLFPLRAGFIATPGLLIRRKTPTARQQIAHTQSLIRFQHAIQRRLQAIDPGQSQLAFRRLGQRFTGKGHVGRRPQIIIFGIVQPEAVTL